MSEAPAALELACAEAIRMPFPYGKSQEQVAEGMHNVLEEHAAQRDSEQVRR